MSAASLPSTGWLLSRSRCARAGRNRAKARRGGARANRARGLSLSLTWARGRNRGPIRRREQRGGRGAKERKAHRRPHHNCRCRLLVLVLGWAPPPFFPSPLSHRHTPHPGTRLTVPGEEGRCRGRSRATPLFSATYSSFSLSLLFLPLPLPLALSLSRTRRTRVASPPANQARTRSFRSGPAVPALLHSRPTARTQILLLLLLLL